MDLTAFLALTTIGSPFVLKILDFIKYLRAKDVNGIVSQGGAWVAGVLVALALKYSDLNAGLDDFNLVTVIIGGFVLGSFASTGFDVIKSVDNSQTAAKPVLIPDAEPDLPESSWPTTGATNGQV